MSATEMNSKEIDALLHRAPFARLSTAGEEFPYVVPLCFLYYEGKIYFHSRLRGKKIDTMLANPRVCLQVDEINGLLGSEKPCKFSVAYESVIAWGEAALVEDDRRKEKILELLTGKYAGDRPTDPIPPDALARTAVAEITISGISGKANRG